MRAQIEKLQMLCKPIFEQLGISYFVHLIIYGNNQYSGIASSIDVYNSVFSKTLDDAGEKICCVPELKASLQKIVFILDANKEDETLRDPTQDFGMVYSSLSNHLIIILDDFEKTRSVYLFHVPRNQNVLEKAAYYNQHKSYFYQFILFYRNKINRDLKLRDLYRNHCAIHYLNMPSVSNENPYTFRLGKEMVSSTRRFFTSSGDAYLTRKELLIMKYVLQGDSAKVIARTLNTSHRTVELHLNNIKKKFGVKMKEIIADQFSIVMKFLDHA